MMVSIFIDANLIDKMLKIIKYGEIIVQVSLDDDWMFPQLFFKSANHSHEPYHWVLTF